MVSVPNMKPKVLLLPTYFPTVKHPVIGSQIHEQTELLSDEIDYRVLYCLSGIGWKRFLWFSFIKFLTGKKLYKNCSKELASGKLNVAGVYYYSNRLLPERINVKLRVEAYEYLLEKLNKEGWMPNLIHARTAEYAGVHAAHLAKKHQLPFLLTENCSFLLDNTFSIQRLINYRSAIESATKVVVVSNYLKSFLLTNNFLCDPITVGNWINEKEFSIASNENNVLKRPFTILAIGYASFIKDWPTFFCAINKIINDFKIVDLKVILCITQIYDEYSKNYFTKEIEYYSLESYFDVRYQVTRDKIADVFKESDVFVSTSVSETFGIATAEAMFSGIPVVATDNGGINDFISDKNGIKVPLRDAEAVANSILKIKIGQIKFDKHQIRGSVMEKFGTEAFKKRMISLYHSCLNNYDK